MLEWALEIADDFTDEWTLETALDLMLEAADE